MVMSIGFKAPLSEFNIHSERAESAQNVMIDWDPVVPYNQSIRAGFLWNLLPPLVLPDLINVEPFVRVYCQDLSKDVFSIRGQVAVNLVLS